MNTNELSTKGPVALKNVAAFMKLTMRLVDREPQESGFGVCHGFSGYGKTKASIFAQNRTGAIRIEVRDSWTRKTLLTSILKELMVKPSKGDTIPDLSARAIRALGEDVRRPLFVDEADRLVDKRMIELVLELQECSGVPVILIGEENLPDKLARVERVYSRVLDWFTAQPCDLDDTRQLANAFAPAVSLTDDLLDEIRRKSGGRARRIINNLGYAKEIARNNNVATLDRATWGFHAYDTGTAPKTRSAQAIEENIARSA
ncbi:AAA family ATPase [Rhodopseudomonas pseudopalustris]|uniref:AAA domain-containing protein n=1 Tax=Rhodopseudomonas pseudopalustris TaxID=1513892 RepID=A0A1H8V9F2_9BRAD|nr:ATP-binding protein [Rhodopseudomonas pseudopalustris]SEP12035.1 AAA domain-containing protein [Rhodopseudomonas pseudopalustris]